MKRSELAFNVTRLAVDIAMIWVAGFATYFLRTEILSAFRPVLFEVNLPLKEYIYLVVLVSFIFIAAYAVLGLYTMKLKPRIWEWDELFKVVIGSSAGVLAVIFYIFLQQELFDSRFLVLGGWLISILFVFVGRIMVHYLQFWVMAKYGFGVHRVLFVDNNGGGKKIADLITQNRYYGYKTANIITELDINFIKSGVENDAIDEVIVFGGSGQTDEKLSKFIDGCHYYHIPIRLVPGMYQTPITAHIDTDLLNGIPLIEFKRTRLDGWGRVLKRTFDIATSMLGIVLLSPIMAIVALAIKWETEGSVFVHLRRVSGTKEFNLHKFRSMIDNAHQYNLQLRAMQNDRENAGPLWKLKDDPRVTKVGRFIRKTRLDEVPQLWNVLRGEISLVGPRPHQSNEVERYEHHHKKVLTVKAGATGPAQVSGSSDISFEEEVALDSFYINNWSLWLDIKIILQTLLKIFSDKSAV